MFHISMETPKQIEHLFPPKNPSLAKTVTEMGLVSLTTSLRVFVVKNPSDETVHVVRNTTNGALCSCASTGKCYHILENGYWASFSY